jgi:hypothetical protein
MNEIQLTVSERERELIYGLLDRELGEVRVEVHRTHWSPEMRADLEAREALVRQMLDKLKLAAVA